MEASGHWTFFAIRNKRPGCQVSAGMKLSEMVRNYGLPETDQHGLAMSSGRNCWRCRSVIWQPDISACGIKTYMVFLFFNPTFVKTL